jgi:hypothetical protein
MGRFLLPAATLALLMGGARQANAGFCITLSVASSGNGALGRGDFRRLVWDTHAGTLDWTRELVRRGRRSGDSALPIAVAS